MARLLEVGEMSHEFFQDYLKYLRVVWGREIADILLGIPLKLEIPKLDPKTLENSYSKQICAICDSPISDHHKEDCLFEHAKEDVKVFYLCECCR